ncbi:MAG: hypothetical protein QF893_04835 [Alphaproteobacteria bacterium]|jgi:hypothetical protein|nr:hypothetical protein [Alphaproteobacteria bacterium]
MSDREDKGGRKTATRKEREARLAAQLKANLHRRKAQARARGEKARSKRDNS